jgi:cbb3-type cytochrome oxidase maturation protein
MSILYVLIPLSVVLMGGAAWALFWAIDAGQFDDVGQAGRSILEDEDGVGSTKV